MKKKLKINKKKEIMKIFGKPEVADFIEFADADDIWIRFYTIPQADYAVPQHAHVHDHITLLCNGIVRLYRNDELVDTLVAPKSILIKAGVKHRFETVTPNVLFACVHNMRGRDGTSPEIAEYHDLEPRTDWARMAGYD